MKIKFFTFSQFHNKIPPTGSTYLRVNQLIKYWPEASLYKYGENPDVLIFQKVYVADDYQFPVHFKGIKILDICDPDWLTWMANVKETCDAMNAVVCPTEGLKKFLSQITDTPIKIIKDRMDVEILPKPIKHTKPAETVVWFGYAHNAETLKPALHFIQEHNLHLLIISDEDPFAWRWSEEPEELKKRYTYKKYIEDTANAQIQKADFAVFPTGTRPQDVFKSENKTVRANLLGLPVANDIESFEKYLDPKARQEWFDTSYVTIKQEYDVRKSVEEYKELIKELENA